MKYINGINFLKDEFPIRERTQFVPAVRRAYSLIKEISQQNDFLNWKVGRDLLPYLRNAAVEFEFKRLIDKGALNYKYRISMNQRRNCNHLEIISPNCVLTISHVPRKIAVPRKALFRSNLSFINQMSIFSILGLQDDDICEDKYYAIMTHGGSTRSLSVPEFVNLGLPCTDVKEWAEILDLTSEPYVIEIPEEAINADDLLEFKVHIENNELNKGVL